MQLVRYRAAGALLLVGAFSSLAAQDVVFRTGIDLVTVDATVLGRDGRPVNGLGPDDFVVKVDGQLRRLVSAQFVDYDAPATRGAQALPARHFTSNEDPDAGRLVVVAVDEAHIRRLEGRAALRAAAAFIDRLDPMDRIAVTSLSRVGVVQFTRDRPALKRRLESLTGQTDPVLLQFNIGLTEATEIADGGRARLAEVVLRECGRSLTEFTDPARADDLVGGRDACPEQLEQEARVVSQHARTQASISLSAIEALVAGLKPLEGPKTVVLLSEGMVVDPRLVDVAELAAAAKDARVSIYGLHLEIPVFEASQDRVSPTFFRDIQLRGDGLARLAGATRGAVFRLVGSDPRPFERIEHELSGYYLLAFEALDGDRDGRVHRVDVALASGGGVLRARPAFRLPTIVPTARTREQDLVALLRESRAATELPVRVATYTYAEPGAAVAEPGAARLRVVVSTEAGFANGPAGHVLLGYVLTDAHGVIAASGAHQATAGRHAFSTVVPAGVYVLRVAAIDPLGRRGRVERPFAAAIDLRQSVRLSDLILAPVPPSPESPLQPFVDRVTASRVMAYVEVYAQDAQRLRDMHVRIEIADEAGSAERVTARAGVTSRDTPLGIARVHVALDGLAPGRYIAYARIIVGAQEVGRTARPFTYSPRDEP